MSDQDKKEAQGKIAEQIKIAENALREAQRIADEAKVHFNWSGPSYGMGGYNDGRDGIDALSKNNYKQAMKKPGGRGPI